MAEQIRQKERKYLRRPRNRYVLLTSISLSAKDQPQTFQVGGFRVKFRRKKPRNFDTDFTARRIRALRLGELPSNYLWLSAETEGRCEYGATTSALDRIDLVRGLWSLYFDRIKKLRVSSGRTTPVNDIGLGPTHTLHKLDGSAACEMFWWEPAYRQPSKLKRARK